jgi:transcriptional regulator with XRE-family HTH domain
MEDHIDAPEGQPSPRALALARAIRAARGDMPQVEFAAYADRPQSVVSNWENGKQTPSLETLCAMEESLGLPLGTFAAQAGYFTGEAAIAAGLPGVPISVLRFARRADALRAVRAADGLGLGVRLSTLPNEGGPEARWLVDVLPVGVVSLPGDQVGGE